MVNAPNTQNASDASSFGSYATVTSLIIEACERRSALQKALEVEEGAAVSDDCLTNNKQYQYSQNQLQVIESNRQKALSELNTKFNATKETKQNKIDALKREMETHLEAYIKRKEDEIAALKAEMERHVESYRARKDVELKRLESEIDTKDSIITDQKNAINEKYDLQITHHQKMLMTIAEKAGVPTAIGYRRKKAELEMMNKKIEDLTRQADAIRERDLKKAKEESLRRLDEERRREDEQRHRDLQVVQAQRAAEREADERKQREREERKKALRTALRACKTLDDVYDVENEQEYMDWEDEELVNSFKKRMRDRSETASHNEIVEEDKGAPLAPPKPVAENTILGSAQILKTTKMMPKTPGVPAQRLPRPF